jgi:hypothetical protein
MEALGTCSWITVMNMFATSEFSMLLLLTRLNFATCSRRGLKRQDLLRRTLCRNDDSTGRIACGHTWEDGSVDHEQVVSLSRGQYTD